ncbi:MAG: hypothetical protein U0172_05860 [Nitrospiraceae bacterium]
MTPPFARLTFARHSSQSFLTASLLLLLVTGCAHRAPDDSPVAREATFNVSAAQVRDATIAVLTEAGYSVDATGDPDVTLTTGYRRETPSPWDWLLRFRLGVGRTKADARVTALSPDSSKLSLDVQQEEKATFWHGWQEGEPPMAQRPETYLRQIKQHLQVL